MGCSITLRIVTCSFALAASTSWLVSAGFIGSKLKGRLTKRLVDCINNRLHSAICNRGVLWRDSSRLMHKIAVNNKIRLLVTEKNDYEKRIYSPTNQSSIKCLLMNTGGIYRLATREIFSNRLVRRLFIHKKFRMCAPPACLSIHVHWLCSELALCLITHCKTVAATIYCTSLFVRQVHSSCVTIEDQIYYGSHDDGSTSVKPSRNTIIIWNNTHAHVALVTLTNVGCEWLPTWWKTGSEPEWE